MPTVSKKSVPLMGVFKTRKNSVSLTRFEALKCVPVKNPEIVEERLENGDVLLIYPVRVRPLLGKLLHRFVAPNSNKVYQKKLQLDALGTAVWDQIDGRRSVRSIIEWFSGKYRMHPQEAETAVTHFLRDLGKRGLIGLK